MWTLTATLDRRSAELGAARAQITSFEAQVATLLSERDTARGQVGDLTAANERLLSDQEALNLALAKARAKSMPRPRWRALPPPGARR